MSRFEKVRRGEDGIQYRMHLNTNYFLYIEEYKGQTYYGIWSEVQQHNIPMIHRGEGTFEWNYMEKTFDLPRSIEEQALRKMEKLYAYYISGGVEEPKTKATRTRKQKINYERLWNGLREYVERQGGGQTDYVSINVLMDMLEKYLTTDLIEGAMVDDGEQITMVTIR